MPHVWSSASALVLTGLVAGAAFGAEPLPSDLDALLRGGRAFQVEERVDHLRVSVTEHGKRLFSADTTAKLQAVTDPLTKRRLAKEFLAHACDKELRDFLRQAQTGIESFTECALGGGDCSAEPQPGTYVGISDAAALISELWAPFAWDSDEGVKKAAHQALCRCFGKRPEPPFLRGELAAQVRDMCSRGIAPRYPFVPIAKPSSHLVDHVFSVRGGLPRYFVQSVLALESRQFGSCVDVAVKSDPKFYGARVLAAWNIDQNGGVANARIVQSTVENPGFSSCLVAKIQKLKFQAPYAGSEVEVAYPMIFRR